MNLKEELSTLISGEIDDSAKALEFHSHDASLFEVLPEVVVHPKDVADIKALVHYVNEHKKTTPNLSLTARSAGTDMSGGTVNDSIIVSFLAHFNTILSVTKEKARFQPGVYYRDFDVETLKQEVILPTYPASRELCTLGGMVNNNSGGEKSLELGKTEDYVTELKVVLADGNEYVLKALNMKELEAKMKQDDFEGKFYRETYELIDKNFDLIKNAKPNVTKNSTGYNIWDVWDKEKGIFDLTKLFVGAQGTLGFVTEAETRLVRHRPFSGLLVCFMKNMDELGEIIPKVVSHKPASFESFDDATLILAFKFMPFFIHTLGLWGLIKLMFSLIPDGLMLLHGIPRLVLMIEFTGESQEEVDEKMQKMEADLKPYKMQIESDNTVAKARKFWVIRHESFNLLRKKVKDKHTAPFIDDLVVPTQHLTEFLPKLQKIIKKYNLLATIAGHMGDGNFHIIPLMKLEDKKERAKLLPAMKEVNRLVLSYKGVLSGEHNDGMIRGPWLEESYGKEVYKIFKDVKHIYDPNNIFNPHKKANADWDWTTKHIRQSF